jgi:peptide/nickel transport system permease protein
MYLHRYIWKRMLLLIPVVLGVSFIIFSILYIIPGDPGSIILGPGAMQADIDKLNAELGYNLPFFQRYFRYIFNAFFRFDLGPWEECFYAEFDGQRRKRVIVKTMGE